MAIDLNTLVPDFKAKVEQLLANCKDAGYPMEPNFAIRTPLQQAALWRQSRTAEVVAQEIQNLRDQRMTFLADTIEAAGPHNGIMLLTPSQVYDGINEAKRWIAYGWLMVSKTGRQNSK